MPGAHTYTIHRTKSTLTMAQDHGLCRKKGKKSQMVHGPPLQARVAAANRTVRTTLNDPGAHGMNRGVGEAK